MADRKTRTVHFGPDALDSRADSSLDETNERVKKIEAMIADGATIPEALEKSGITEEIFEQWLDESREKNLLEADRRTRLAHEAARLKRVTGFLADAKTKLDKRISKHAQRPDH